MRDRDKINRGGWDDESPEFSDDRRGGWRFFVIVTARRQLIRAFTSGLALAALICGAAASPAGAQSAAPSAPQVRVDVAPPSGSSDDTAALAEKLQNPIADLISLPFQNNANFNVGPNKGTQDILNIQPVIPFHLNQDWNLITRTILPLTWSPSYQPAASVPPFGLSPISFSAFLSPTKEWSDWTFGGGPIVELPTATNKNLGSNVWGLGPAFVVVRVKHPWVYGTLVNTVFSLGGTSGRGGTSYIFTTINPFANYNFNGGWFVGSNLIMTASWDTGGEKWTLPVGVQAGRLIKIGGKLPVNLLVGAYYNALRPPGVGTWQLRTQVTFVF